MIDNALALNGFGTMDPAHPCAFATNCLDWGERFPIEMITLANPGFDPRHARRLNFFISKKAMILPVCHTWFELSWPTKISVPELASTHCGQACILRCEHVCLL
jgi:hypothetical protein